MRKVFLCHASEDKSKAMEVYSFLKKEGCNPWLDKIDLLAGQNWKIEIQKALKSSDFVVILFSKHSVSKKGFVQREFKLALDILEEIPEEQLFIIPVRIEECRIPDRFIHLQYCDFFEPRDLQYLLKSIQFQSQENPLLKRPLANPITNSATIKISDSKPLLVFKAIGSKIKSLLLIAYKSWQTYLYYLGISVYILSFFLPVLQYGGKSSGRSYYYGYDAAWITFESVFKDEPLSINSVLKGIFLNFSNMSVLLVLFLTIAQKKYSEYRKMTLCIIPILGVISAAYWCIYPEYQELKSGYWTWFISILVTSLSFTSRFIKPKKSKVRFAG